jgi:tetratricopeptide (TPR) repeat protein
MAQRRGLRAALHTAGPVHRPVEPIRSWSGRLTPSASADLELLRASALLDADPASAARRASGILVDAPDHSEAKLLLAAACRRLGDPGKALGVLEAVAAAHPEVPVMQLELGRAYAAAGRRADAVAAYRRAVALNAELVEAWRELATELFAAGDAPGGDAAYAEFERRVADPPGLHNALGALADNRLDAAEALLRERLRQTPHDVVALRLLAEVATRRNDPAEAERRLNECLELAPGYARARYDLACVQFTLQRPERVLPLVERLLRLDPRHAACRRLKARTLRLVDRADEAIALMELAITENAEDYEAWLLLGHLRREGGQQAGAIEAYRRALELRPDSSEAYWSLANLKTYRLDVEDVDAIRRLLARSSLLPADRERLEFALGEALEDEGQIADAFAHYARGNALHRATVAYDADAATAAMRRSKTLYTAEFFRDRSGWGSERNDPIFIVGVPRSGSTLLEQMLASHSQVEGTRELSDLSIVVNELTAHAATRGQAAYPELVATLGRPEIEAAAAQYLERTQAHRSLGKPRFIDKMPANFSHVGLIQLMFPNAAIIDARRHPLGCAFSCYKQLFAFGAAFSYDQVELGRHIRDYAELMEHFDAVLPGRVYRVYYERLVAAPEAELKALLGHCGLAFESGCLRFYENRRIVQSVSSEQVRMPILSEGVDHWRSFEAWLGPLKDALGDLVDRYPAAGG